MKVEDGSGTVRTTLYLLFVNVIYASSIMFVIFFIKIYESILATQLQDRSERYRVYAVQVFDSVLFYVFIKISCSLRTELTSSLKKFI